MTSQSEQEVIVALLEQQEAMLSELRWAYAQLERLQDTEVAQLKQRVAELEEAMAKAESSRLIPDLGFAAKTRKRVEFTLQHPDRAARVARQKLSRVAKKAGFLRS